jgi:hypothetical protein
MDAAYNPPILIIRYHVESRVTFLEKKAMHVNIKPTLAPREHKTLKATIAAVPSILIMKRKLKF